VFVDAEFFPVPPLSLIPLHIVMVVIRALRLDYLASSKGITLLGRTKVFVARRDRSTAHVRHDPALQVLEGPAEQWENPVFALMGVKIVLLDAYA
jgi:hypothetical protein